MKAHTSAFTRLALVTVLAFGFAACEEENVINLPPEQVELTLTPQAATLDVGDQIQLSAVVRNADNNAVSFTSSNPSVASVDGSGTVTANAPGTATITATAAADPNAKASAVITVNAPPPPPPPPAVTIEVAPGSATIPVGGTIQLVATVSNTDNKAVTWSSASPGVASVSSTGLVTGVAPGTAVITATSAADPNAVATATITVEAPPPVAVSVSPSSASIAMGQTLQLTASVANATNQAVNWTSSDNAVATVSAAGVVTGVAAGTAIITATSQEDPSKSGSATITVLGSSVSIASITQFSTVLPVNPNNVFGQINVALNVDVPPGVTHTVEVLVDGDNVCSQTVTPGSASQAAAEGAPVQILCTVNTAQFKASPNDPAFDASDPLGTTRFLNGPHALTARVRFGATQQGTVVASTSTQLIFNNVDTFFGVIATANTKVDFAGNPFPQSAFDATGLLWFSGNVTVQANPVIYTRDATGNQNVVASATVFFAGSTRAATPANNYTVTFPASAAVGANGGVAAVNTGPAGAAPTVTASIFAAGQPGPIGILNAAALTIRLDNQAPAAGTFAFTAQGNVVGGPATPLCCSNFWANPGYSFASGKAGQADAGVGLHPTMPVVFFAGAGNGAAANTHLVAPANQMNTPNLPETPNTNLAYEARAVVYDALGNTSGVDLDTDPTAAVVTTFGVDATNPTLAYGAGSAANQARLASSAGVNYILNYTDVVSGFAGPGGADGIGPLAVRVTRNFSTSAANCILGIVSGGVCAGHEIVEGTNATTTVEVDGDPLTDTHGYYTFEAFVLDQSGLTATVASRTVLVDDAAPAAANPQFPVTLTGGAPASFAIDMTDDVDLESFAFGLRFLGATTDANGVLLGQRLPFTGGNNSSFVPVTGADGFGGSLITARNDEPVTINFIRSVEQTTAGDAPSGALVSASDIFWRMLDVRGNEGFSGTFAFAGGTVPGGSPAPTAGSQAITSWRVTAPAAGTNVCDVNVDGSCAVPTQLTVRAVVTGPTGTFQPPFAEVIFYRRDRDNLLAQAVEVVGRTSAAVQQDNGVVRTYTYTVTLDATGYDVQNNMPIFALGVFSDGDGLRTNGVLINVVQ